MNIHVSSTSTDVTRRAAFPSLRTGRGPTDQPPTPIMRPFVFIQLSAREGGTVTPWQGIVIPRGFMGNLGALSSLVPRRGPRVGRGREAQEGGGGAKLKMSIKSIKSEAQGRLPWNILRQRGNSFSYAISISCFASSRRHRLSPSLPVCSPPSFLSSARPRPPTSDLSTRFIP